ncbi:MAG: protease/CBS domain protein [Myxococcales bacterium]|nr:protease/CBS domain protein [Myxococcales bacterium]
MGTCAATHDGMHGRGSLTLLHVRGVPIRAHWTLLLVLPYLMVVFSVQFAGVARMAGVDQVRLALPPLVWGAILAVGLLASVTLHELAHVAVAKRFGGRVRGITLMLLGGVSQISKIPRRPRYEGLMALAGPAVSLLLGVLCVGLEHIVSGPADLKMGLFYLGYLNITLGVFNLIPAFPMDGGRILRALLAARMGSLRATQVAARVGRAAAILMGIVGLWSGNFLLLLIAIFIYVGAGAEATGERVRATLEGLRIADLVPRHPPPMISSDAAVSDVLPQMHDAGRLEMLVTEPSGRPQGVIRAADLIGITAADRTQLRVGELIARFPERQMEVPWDANLDEVIERAAEQGRSYIVVFDPGTTTPHSFVGLITPSDIETMIALRMAETQRGQVISGSGR